MDEAFTEMWDAATMSHAEPVHDASCTGCDHDCPWKGNPIGAPFCHVCDDHWEAGAD